MVKDHTTLLVLAKLKKHRKPFAILHNRAQMQWLVQATHKSDCVPGAVLAHVGFASQLGGTAGVAGSQLQASSHAQGCSRL